MKNHINFVSILIASASLIACGGGGGGSNKTDEPSIYPALKHSDGSPIEHPDGAPTTMTMTLEQSRGSNLETDTTTLTAIHKNNGVYAFQGSLINNGAARPVALYGDGEATAFGFHYENRENRSLYGGEYGDVEPSYRSSPYSGDTVFMGAYAETNIYTQKIRAGDAIFTFNGAKGSMSVAGPSTLKGEILKWNGEQYSYSRGLEDGQGNVTKDGNGAYVTYRDGVEGWFGAAYGAD